MPQFFRSGSARKAALCAALSVALLVMEQPAHACDCVSLIPGGPNFSRDLEAIAEFYPIAGEGRVFADGPFAWRFVPTKEYRGPGQASYRIELSSDCSLSPDEVNSLIGRTVFLLLSGGPARYEAGRCVNLQSPAVESAIRHRIEMGCAAR